LQGRERAQSGVNLGARRRPHRHAGKAGNDEWRAIGPVPLRGCGQKDHAPRCEALPGVDPGCISRLAHGLFD
jgi:hypothetical protein